jgi:hypothetical protein
MAQAAALGTMLRYPSISVSLLLRQLPQGREVLRALLVDRMTFTPIITAGTRGYRFVDHGSHGGLLTGTTWPTISGGPKGICMVVGHDLVFEVNGTALRP